MTAAHTAATEWVTQAVQPGFIAGTLVFALLAIADRWSPRLFFLAAAAAGWYRDSLGQALGFLVGALVLGTAFPHLLQAFSGGLAASAQRVLLSISALTIAGGALLFWLVPDGPYMIQRGRAAQNDAGNAGETAKDSSLRAIFADAEFRRAASGYFGHMWELYSFWSLSAGSLTVARANLALSGLLCLASPLLLLVPVPVTYWCGATA